MKIRISFVLVAKMQVQSLVKNHLVSPELGGEITRILEHCENLSTTDNYAKLSLRNEYNELAGHINYNKVLFESLSETLQEFREELYM